MRLSNNKVVEIEDERDISENSDDNQDDDDDDNDHSRLNGKSKTNNDKNKKDEQEDSDEEISAGDLTSIFRSKKVLNNALNERTVPKSIKSLKLIFNMVVVLIMAMAFINQFYTDNKYKVEIN